MPAGASAARTRLSALVSRRLPTHWLPWLLFGLICVLVALDFLFIALSWMTPVPDIWGFRGDGAIIALAAGGMGWLLARRRPQNAIGWLFLIAGVAASIYRFGIDYSTYALITQPGTLPGGALAAWTASWLWVAQLGLLVYVFLLFPTGHVPSPRWQIVGWALVSAFALMILLLMSRPGPLYNAPYLDNPATIRGNEQVITFLNQVVGVSLLLIILLVGASIILRLVHAQGVERQQLKWFTYVAVLVCITGVINTAGSIFGQFNIGPKLFQFFTVVILATIPLTVGLAILRYRLWDIDLIINRTLVYGTLSAGILVIYLLTVGLLGGLLNTDVNLAAVVVTIGLTILLFQPLRSRLQQLFNHRVTGASNPPNSNADTRESQTSPNNPLDKRWHTLAHVAWFICAVLAVFIFLAAIPLGYAPHLSGATLGYSLDAPGWYTAGAGVTMMVFSMLAALVSLALAVILFWKRRDDAMGLLVSFYLIGYGIGLGGPLEALNGFQPLSPGAPASTGALVSSDLILGIQAALFIPMLLFFYLFPNGRFVPNWTRHATLLSLLLSPFFIYITLYGYIPTISPLGWSVIVILLFLLGAGIYAQVYRYRRVASAVERQQTKWVVFGLVLTFLTLAVLQIPYVILSQLPAGAAHPWWEPLSGSLWWIALCILPISLAIAVTGYRLWDIDLILNRGLVYGTLTASIVAVYILLVAGLGALLQTGGNLLISLLATGLIAVLFQPLRERFQRGANRLIYGERDNPYAVLSRLGQRLDATLEPEAVLPTIVETVAQALKLPYAGIELKAGDAFHVAAEYRSPRSTFKPGEQVAGSFSSLHDGVQAIPLVHQSEVVGQLLVSPRTPGEGLNGADRHLLEQFAMRAGIAIHALRLTRDLQHSRARLVTAREEERRRIRRDLHDGLGPVLASLAMQADNARESTRTNPAQTEAALADITSNAQGALQDIRRLVYDLRPPALDDLGLLGALRQVAANAPTRLHIDLEAPDHMPPLSAAVEVAAYRITQEALNNVMRHSGAQNCIVRICVQDDLQLAIADDGEGMQPDARAGVGLISMRERATELGGSCIIESTPGGGTQVLARLPLAVEQDQDG